MRIIKKIRMAFFEWLSIAVFLFICSTIIISVNAVQTLENAAINMLLLLLAGYCFLKTRQK